MLNNIYILQLGYHPVAVVILHVHKYGKEKKVTRKFNPLNAELNPICHLLALLGGATIVVVSRLRV